ncbi:MAG: hypothetical protein HQL76_03360 [Magnetococcales bacterium]|nr:hypothetical protein [Magnetococcales bacterium]
MYRRLFFFCLLPLFVIAAPPRGTAIEKPSALLLLVHGYVSDPDAWNKSGISGILEQGGWRHGAVIPVGADGRFQLKSPPEAFSRRYHLADIPSEAPLEIQAEILARVMAALRQRHPETVLFAAGHSAGGVALRLMMVRRPDLGVAGLITIAAPHRGTDTAKLARFLTRTPMTLMTPFLGLGTLNRSAGLYADLAPEEQGNLLFRLNHSEHPKAHYLSIVRKAEGPLPLDPIVAPDSQDLTRIQALGSRAITVFSGSDHSLEARDGQWMNDYLQRWLDALPAPQTTHNPVMRTTTGVRHAPPNGEHD